MISCSLTEICQHCVELDVCLYYWGGWGKSGWQRHFTPVPLFIIFCPEDTGSWHVTTWANLHHSPSPSQLLSFCQIEVFMVVAVKNTVFWDVMPCNLVFCATHLIPPKSQYICVRLHGIHSDLPEYLNLCHILIYCSLDFYSDFCLIFLCQVNVVNFFSSSSGGSTRTSWWSRKCAGKCNLDLSSSKTKILLERQINSAVGFLHAHLYNSLPQRLS